MLREGPSVRKFELQEDAQRTARPPLRIAIRSSSVTNDPFKEPWNARHLVGIIAIAVVTVAALALGLAIEYYPAISPARRVVGVVQSSGAISLGKINGGTRETASIRLADGNVVLAYVNFGGPLPAGEGSTLSSGPLSTGDSVTLLEQPRLLLPPSYEVIAKNTR